MYSTDNGPNMFSWPDGAMTPFRNEKNTNWEGAYRVPCVVRWPGKIKPGSVSNEMVAHHDWLPTFLAMAGDAEVTDKLLKGYTIGDMTYKVHLDGYNLVPYLTGEAQKSPRVSFIYCNDDQQVVALRYDNWKIVFAEQRQPGTMRVWSEPFVTLRVPKMFNLRTDPFERADITSITYYDWLIDHVYLLVPAQAYVGEFLADIQGLSAAPEGRQLQPRRRAPEDAGERPTRNSAEPDRGRPSVSGGPPSGRAAERKGADRRIWLRKRREHRRPPIQPTRCALSTRATHIRRRSRPRSASRALSEPRSASGIVPSAVANGEAAGKSRDSGRRLRNIPGCHPCAARTRRSGDRNRHQRNQPAPRRASFSKNTACETSIFIGSRSKRSGSSARHSTRSSAPACSTTCPTRISAFGRCAMSLRPTAQCI